MFRGRGFVERGVLYAKAMAGLGGSSGHWLAHPEQRLSQNGRGWHVPLRHWESWTGQFMAVLKAKFIVKLPRLEGSDASPGRFLR
jgi:hypothetical protein